MRVAEPGEVTNLGEHYAILYKKFFCGAFFGFWESFTAENSKKWMFHFS